MCLFKVRPAWQASAKNMRLILAAGSVAVLVDLHAPPAPAANIAVTNVTLTGVLYAGMVTDVRFDVKWDASWRASWTETNVTPNVTVTNWDAAWIFVKYRCRDGADTNWNHAPLSTNNHDHTSPTGSIINVGLSTNAGGAYFGAGVFLFRSEEGSGSWTNAGVKLRWRYGADGVASTARVDVCVHAIEMVYVPQGSFYLGDGCTGGVGTEIQGQFENGQFTNAFLVTNDNYIIYLGGGTNGNLGNNNASGMAAGWTDDFNDVTGQILPAAFPKGYSAFYCMKYAISQGQYADFLGQLTYPQATNRYPGYSGLYRHTVTNLPSYSAGAPARACNYLSWADGAAYADWSGLRPMTELEYEKICRGPLFPVTNEFAWGTNTIVADNGHGTIDVSSPENGAETNTTDMAAGAAVYGNNAIYVGGVSNALGPVRCGLFATVNSGRVLSGSTYWGIMEMSGNLWERPVTVGNSTGREFAGAHGEGNLDNNGNADVPTWPGTGASGAGFRGGSWSGTTPYLRASDRYNAAFTYSARHIPFGWRAVRSAPGVVP